MDNMKICVTCKKSLSIDDFHKQSKSVDGLQHNCKACSRSISKKYRRENTDLYRPKWRKSALNKVGFTPELFDSMLESQGNVCALCFTDNPGGRWNSFFADHDHNTGKARGVLCMQCNTILGVIESKDKNWMIRARKYLDNGGI